MDIPILTDGGSQAKQTSFYEYLIRFNQVILKLDVENLKLEIFFGRIFYFTMDFHDFFILNVVFLKLFHLDFRAHRADSPH